MTNTIAHKKIKVSYEETTTNTEVKEKEISLPYYSKFNEHGYPTYYKIVSENEVICVMDFGEDRTHIYCTTLSKLMGEQCSEKEFDIVFEKGMKLLNKINSVRRSSYTKEQVEMMLHEEEEKKRIMEDFHRMGNEDRI